MPSEAFRALALAIAAGDADEALRRLAAAPDLARSRAGAGATRQEAKAHFLPSIGHYLYEGDTAAHIAAAGYRVEVLRALVAAGADIRARNRRGAEPLHYAADGVPGAAWWNPAAQAATIACLIAAGADPNAADRSGVAPLHRAVRTRCAAAVAALLDGGADPKRRNGKGSEPLALARLATGRGGSGSPAAKAEQAAILRLLGEA